MVLQTTNTVLMVSPDTFQFNEQTAATNAFQVMAPDAEKVRDVAMLEFAQMVEKLKQHGIRVLVLPSRDDLPTPDAVFPNNWFSLHVTAQGERIAFLYPMLSASRRAERQWDKLKNQLIESGFKIDYLIDLTEYEARDQFLEGTGSLVIDRVNQIAYAALSPRTDRVLVERFCQELHYKPIIFHASDKNGMAIYHTNVIMSVGAHFAVVVTESIQDSLEREQVLASLNNTQKKVINLSLKQMELMAGNILEVQGKDGRAKIVLSETAHNVFTDAQKHTLLTCADLVVVNIETIERIGGGSARCMLAEIF